MRTSSDALKRKQDRRPPGGYLRELRPQTQVESDLVRILGVCAARLDSLERSGGAAVLEFGIMRAYLAALSALRAIQTERRFLTSAGDPPHDPGPASAARPPRGKVIPFPRRAA